MMQLRNLHHSYATRKSKSCLLYHQHFSASLHDAYQEALAAAKAAIKVPMTLSLPSQSNWNEGVWLPIERRKSIARSSLVAPQETTHKSQKQKGKRNRYYPPQKTKAARESSILARNSNIPTAVEKEECFAARSEKC